MKKILKTTFVSLIIISCLSFSFTASAVQQDTGSAQSNEVPYQSYTYWVDYNTSEKTPVYSKPMYEVYDVLSAKYLGADGDSRFNDVTADTHGNIYILDSGNSRIYILDKNYKLSDVLQDIIYNGEKIEFVDALGIFVDNEGLIYIADTENQRVLVINKNGIVQKLLLLPDSELIPTSFNYRPVKVAVDSKGYTYIASDGSYYGAILYSPEMEFLGFYGANTVKSTALDVISNLWKRLTSNDIKRAADELKLPFAFSDMVLGPDDFVYTTTGSGSNDVQVGQLCILNPGGKDVLGKSTANFADYSYGTYQYTKQYQNLSRLDVDENGFIYALDMTYGRIFWYDSECNLFSVFGGSLGPGDKKGTFSLASAIALKGTDVLVTDSKKNTLTIFKLTEFGGLVRNAQITTVQGDFAAGKEAFEEAIKLDTNCQIAYRGLAKAYYDLGDNTKAMEYAKLGVDRDTYAKAFKLSRTELLEKNFGWIFLGLFVIIALIVFIKVKSKGKERVFVINSKLKTALSSVVHPNESFRLVKEKGEGSVIISVVLLALFYIVTVLNDTVGGFAFTVFDSENYNAFYVLMSTVGFALLWVISNWLVCTLAGGIGKMDEILSVTSYSLIPIIFARAVNLVLTHVLVPDEGAFLNIFMVVCTGYALFMLIIGMMKIHDYEFGKFIATTIFTLVGILIIVFLLFLLFMLTQQVMAWINTVYTEIRYR